TSMRLEPFPIRKKPFIMPSFQFTSPLNRERDGEVAGPGLSEIERRGRIQIPEYIPSGQSIRKSRQGIQIDDESTLSTKSKAETRVGHFGCTTGIALVDQPVGVNAVQFLFDFEHHRISMHSFIIAALPPSSSRIMPVIDENSVMKTLKGGHIKLINHIHSKDVNIVKDALAKNSEFLKDYYSSENLQQENDKDNNNNDNTTELYIPKSHNSIPLFYDNSDGKNIIQQKKEYKAATNQLYKSICKQQYNLDTLIITFPNKTIHKHQVIESALDDESSEEQNTILSESSTENEDNQNNMKITIDQQEISDNDNDEDDNLLIFSNKSSNMNSSLTANKPIPNFHPFLIITSIAIGFFTSHLTLLRFMFQIPFSEPPMSVLYVGRLEQDPKNIGDRSPKSPNEKDSQSIRKRQQHYDNRSVDKLFITAGRALIIIS
ncbi:MAG: hypothetical protein EZS28_046757, partial [Streblomastix strix]